MKQDKTNWNTDVVPPAFTEVWKLMFQSVLDHFKHDADSGAQPPVTKNQSLRGQQYNTHTCQQST